MLMASATISLADRCVELRPVETIFCGQELVWVTVRREWIFLSSLFLLVMSLTIFVGDKLVLST